VSIRTTEGATSLTAFATKLCPSAEKVSSAARAGKQEPVKKETINKVAKKHPRINGRDFIPAAKGANALDYHANGHAQKIRVEPALHEHLERR